MMMIRISIFLLALVAPSFQQETCGYSQLAPNNTNEYIVNGQNAVKGAWPWIAAMIENHRPVCGGSIISDRWIVSAAHCFPGRVNVRNWIVGLGDHNLFSMDENDLHMRDMAYRVEKIIRHGGWRGGVTDYGDIALVKTDRPIKFNHRVQAICLPNDTDVFDEMEPMCWAAGWGEDFGTAQNPHLLQNTHSQIARYEDCNRQHRGQIMRDAQICFGDGRTGTCMGDSGGPLMCKRGEQWVLAGATSWGSTECQGSPGVFTKIAHYKDWILDKIF